MPRYGFAIDNRACIGCHACTVACKSEHQVPLGVNRTWVKYIEKGEFPQTRRFFNVQRCNHCENAPCVEICPVTALYTRPDGIVDFDNSRCIGCKACMQACPYDALYLDPETNTAAKCNYCTHRVENGYEPACVIVCPVEAIVSGDLDDPESRIAQLERMHKVQYPKPEKGTQPKLFYVGGDSAALDPTAAPPLDTYLWSGNDGRISLPILQKASDEAERESAARRTYDPKSKPAPWGWMVSAYITTKAIATGLVIVPFLIFALNLAPSVLPTPAFLGSLLFLAITGALLVADLKQPSRFLYVLFRPQWKSWLVRGAYLIGAFSLLAPINWALGLFRAPFEMQLGMGGFGAFLAACVAVYTAFLLAQAKGRDYWQNSLITISMFVDALVAGAAACQLLGLMHWSGGGVLVADSVSGPLGRWGAHTDPARLCLGVGVVLLAGMTLAELLPKHPTKNAELTARVITRGSLASWFWLGVIGVGLLLPMGILLGGGPLATASILMILGIAAKNHVLVQAPQRVPLA